MLFHDVDLQVRGGERIALIGDNGTGKSTLIKMLMEEEYPDEGKIKFGPSVRIAYLPQIVEFDVPERNLVDTMLYSKRNITPQSARNRLAAFHFTGEDVFKSVSVLSGGELSRIMLAIKNIVARYDVIDTLIFDEIDTGISGRTAQKVSEKMAQIGQRHQVICITHLPQIAAMADSHFEIEKNVEENETVTSIHPLSEEDSVRELARMLGGAKITDSVLANASEMKELAQVQKSARLK